MLSHLQFGWGGQNYGGAIENVSIQAGVNDSCELQVGMNKNTDNGEEDYEG
jgi:hypothetical protein